MKEITKKKPAVKKIVVKKEITKETKEIKEPTVLDSLVKTINICLKDIDKDIEQIEKIGKDLEKVVKRKNEYTEVFASSLSKITEEEDTLNDKVFKHSDNMYKQSFDLRRLLITAENQPLDNITKKQRETLDKVHNLLEDLDVIEKIRCQVEEVNEEKCCKKFKAKKTKHSKSKKNRDIDDKHKEMYDFFKQ